VSMVSVTCLFDDLHPTPFFSPTHASRNHVLQTMSLTSQSTTSLNTLLTFLNSHSPETESFARKDIQWLFQIPSLAGVLNRVVSATLTGDDCVLGVDELELYFPCNMCADVGMKV
jgi:hypothetical protein